MSTPIDPTGPTGRSESVSGDTPAVGGGNGRGPSRARWVAAAVLLLVGAAGLSAGVALDRHVLLPRHAERERDPRRGRGPVSPEERARLRQRFAKDLGLTPEQQPRVDSIMDLQVARMDSVRAESRRRFEALIEESQKQLETVLTPEQQARFRELQKRRRPPGGGERGGRGDGPGEPGGPPPRP